MSNENDFKMLFDVSLSVDEAGVERGDEAIIGDQNVRLLLRENRIALKKGKSTPVHPPDGADPELAYYDVPLICVVHSHPECRFCWSRLVVDFSKTNGAIIRDMVPREVRGDRPVEYKTTIGVGAKFEVASKILGAEVKPEYTSSRTVYYPEIVSSGVGFTSGQWDFLALGNEYLHANRELRLLVSARNRVPMQARFTLRAKVKFTGAMGFIPLMARHGEINEVYLLD